MGSVTALSRTDIADPPKDLVGVASTQYALPGTEDNVAVRGQIVGRFATPT